MPDTGGEKSEAPTPRRLQESREQGQVARSQDLAAAVALLGAMILLGMFGQQLFFGMQLIVHDVLSGRWVDDSATTPSTPYLWVASMGTAVRAITPIALGTIALGILGNLLQIGFLFTLKPLAPNLGKLSPIKGLQNLFSMRSLVKFAMSMGKVFIVLAVATAVIYFDMPKIVGLAHLPTEQMVAAAASLVYWLGIKIAAVLIIIAILDFAYQKWQFTEDQKMTKEEVKEEMKRMEGDPLVKQRRAKVARQLAMQRMGQAVPTADVVVTNPTHFSIALKYDDSMTAPKVVAKGADLMAMRIRQLAVANGVPIVERPPLARALYRHVEVGQEIPEKYYSAVAEILAYVYRINNESRAAVAG